MVTTNDDRLAERLRLLRNLGFTKPRFRHEVAGYNFRMTSYQAAMGLAQLEKIDMIINEKRRVAAGYNALLADVPGLRLPVELNWARNVYWMYALTVEPEFGLSRDELSGKLAQAGVETRTFFCPMNRQPVFKELPGFRSDDCPVADRLWETGLYLPSAPTLTDEKLEFVRDAIVAARN
jgi:perosamine synthetase